MEMDRLRDFHVLIGLPGNACNVNKSRHYQAPWKLPVSMKVCIFLWLMMADKILSRKCSPSEVAWLCKAVLYATMIKWKQ